LADEATDETAASFWLEDCGVAVEVDADVLDALADEALDVVDDVLAPDDVDAVPAAACVSAVEAEVLPCVWETDADVLPCVSVVEAVDTLCVAAVCDPAEVSAATAETGTHRPQTRIKEKTVEAICLSIAPRCFIPFSHGLCVLCVFITKPSLISATWKHHRKTYSNPSSCPIRSTFPKK
jgi:hypothetical protein